MAQTRTIDISRLIDEHGLNSVNVWLVIFAFFIILLDGYDIGAAAFAAPALIKAWHITDRGALGTLFSSSLFGILFGSPIFGWIGDHYGRIKALVASCLVIGIFSLATMAATGLSSLIVMRFLTGIGIGGMLPNVIALNAEYAPRRARATMIIVMFTGITFGGAVPGPVAREFIPTYGWQVLFFIGGVAPIIMAVLALLFLPESLKYLAVKTERRDKIAATLRAMTPSVQVGAATRFVVSDEQVYKSFRPSQLFADGLHWITPLLWVCFICNLMSFYFVNSWLPTVLTAAHMPLSKAVLSTTIFQIGGTLGGLSLSRPIDKMGLAPVCILFVISLVVAPFIGYTAGSEGLLWVAIFFAGFTLLGLQFGLNATSALIYPTSIRSNGSGWAFAVGRFGSVAGPIVAGVLIGMKLSMEHLFLFLVLPLAIGTVCSIILARLYYTRFQGMGLHRRDALDEVARAAR